MSEQWFERDPLWFKRAVFYEIHIRGFFDGNDDGSGDFRGLIDKLDYLEWLGVDCLWLLPMYESPLRDGGYDISNFFALHPDYGSVDDFREFVEQAHQRGMRVIADLVMNHTSADHPWFVESRTDQTNPKHDWYVWSDTDERYPEARVIFIDAEPSNWTLDPLRGEYYWHRFFHHQPDLNYDNPAVREAMLEVLRFWLDLGIDGFRLDAVPYLFERDGTNGENLPETHEYLKRVRAEVDARYPDRLLLAEANQWPEDVVDYFGDGDECQMCFHFPVMPRMFMSLRREDATPIYEILDRTPTIPDNCQWGLFLRNHDELTLEMVTDEERDYMYSEYAKDPRMKLNLGIRRRLAPLLDAGRDEAELLHAILFRSQVRRSSITGTRSGWATTCISATGTACARRCSGRATATPASRAPTGRSCTSSRSWIPSTASRRSMSRRSCGRRTRCCAGCSASSRCARSTPCSGSAPTSRCAPRTRGSSPTSVPGRTT